MDQLANRYRVLGKLGEGGMGTVYRVADRLSGDRELALKTIRMDGGVTPAARLRFKAEFHAMARLKHPNTLEVFDFGELDAENLYLTMALVPGTELSARIGGRPMPLGEVYALLIQLLKALGFIHARQYVHRDIKADNIRVTPEGTLKLMDFGLMSRMGLESNRQVTGTPGYLAPEVARGGLIDGTSDLYSVGCLAYEMLTGRLPFEGTLVEVVRAHIATPPVPPSRLRELPDALERLVLRLLEKDPRRRYRDAAEVIDDLVPLSGLAIARENADQRQSYLSTSELVGRDRELGELTAALNAAIAGQARALVIGAPAGVGKSRLVTELLLQAKLDGVLVLHGRCHEAGMAPYQALVEALRPALAHGTPEEAARYAPAVAKFFPELAKDQEAAEDPQTLREAMADWLFAVSARVPLLLVLDDIHWADPQTLDAFNHIVRRLGSQRLLCLATLRNDEVPPGAVAWYTVDEGSSALMRLGPLTPKHQLALLQAMLGPIQLPDAFAEALYAATGGNPFFTTEVVRALLDDGHVRRRGSTWHFPGDASALAPLGSMEATLATRLAKLSDAGQALLGAAAVLGARQDLAMLCATTDWPADAVLDALDELIERQFMHREEEGYSFPHARVREVVYARLDAETRRRLHRRAGEHLEERHPDAQPVLHVLAHHYVQAGVHEKAYRYAEAAGDHAEAARADIAAVDAWVQAEAALRHLALPDRLERQRKLWFAIAVNSITLRPELGVRCLQELANSFSDVQPGTPEWLQLMQAYGLMAVSYGFAGHVPQAFAAAERAEALVAARPEPALQAAAIFMRCAALFSAGRFDEARERAQRVWAMLEPLGHEALPLNVRGAIVGSLGMQNAHALQGERPDAALRERANAAATAMNDEQPFTVSLYFGLWAAWTGRHGEAQAYIAATEQKCRNMGAPPYPWVLYLRPYLLAQQGEFEAAGVQLERALAMPHLHQIGAALHHTLALRGGLLLERGELDAARTAFESLEAQARVREMPGTSLLARYGLGQVALARKDWPAARAAFEAGHALAKEGPVRNPMHQGRYARALGELALAQGDPSAARAALESALAIFQAQDNPFEQAHTWRALGETREAQHERDAAKQAYHTAGTLFHQLRLPHHLHGITLKLEALQQIKPREPQAGLTPMARWQLLSGR